MACIPIPLKGIYVCSFFSHFALSPKDFTASFESTDFIAPVSSRHFTCLPLTVAVTSDLCLTQAAGALLSNGDNGIISGSLFRKEAGKNVSRSSLDLVVAKSVTSFRSG